MQYILRYITYLVLDSTALYVGDHFEEEIVQTSRESHHPVNIESAVTCLSSFFP